jgi:hypothetical protein
MHQRFESFEEFWPHYLRAHSKPGTRFCHYCATVFGVGSALLAVVTLTWWLVPVGIVGGYGIAIASHPLIEGNTALVRPHTVWVAMSDLRMFALAVTGRLGRELEKYQIGRS